VCRSCGVPLDDTATNAAHALPAGTKLQGGNFTVGQVLGQGGFGITYVGSDTGLRRAAAIKEFFPDGSTRQGKNVQPGGGHNTGEFQNAKATFLEEARILAQFQHPNIVDVYTVFEENNTAYMVMEYLRGRDVMQLLEERGAAPEAESLGIIEHVAAALEVVHQAGMLHQDVKPDNIVINSDGRVVLIDFGLTRKIETATKYGTVRLSGNMPQGTAGYAPLEQYGRQARVGIYTDVYALAATLYHLLTGAPPPEATDRAAGMELADPRLSHPEISAATAQAVMQGLAMEPAERPQSVREFMDLLGSGARPPDIGPAPRPMPSAPPRPMPSAPEYSAPLPRVTYAEPEPARPFDLAPPAPDAPLSVPDNYQQTYEQQDSYPNQNYPPVPIVAPGFGCVRGVGCAMGCVFAIILFILLSVLQLFGSFFISF
ncbi:MAG TPA: protein kinase, partial [Abditibacteriaceae bacterium]|nr:protein kinase [Abditibacteriaceae bacterium]